MGSGNGIVPKLFVKAQIRENDWCDIKIIGYAASTPKGKKEKKEEEKKNQKEKTSKKKVNLIETEYDFYSWQLLAIF